MNIRVEPVSAVRDRKPLLPRYRWLELRRRDRRRGICVVQAPCCRKRSSLYDSAAGAVITTLGTKLDVTR